MSNTLHSPSPLMDPPLCPSVLRLDLDSDLMSHSRLLVVSFLASPSAFHSSDQILSEIVLFLLPNQLVVEKSTTQPNFPSSTQQTKLKTQKKKHF